MGVVDSITAAAFPRQSEYVGKAVTVLFHYDTAAPHVGTVVRDDLEAPWETIIALGDGRYVRGPECQWSPD